MEVNTSSRQALNGGDVHGEQPSPQRAFWRSASRMRRSACVAILILTLASNVMPLPFCLLEPLCTPSEQDVLIPMLRFWFMLPITWFTATIAIAIILASEGSKHMQYVALYATVVWLSSVFAALAGVDYVSDSPYWPSGTFDMLAIVSISAGYLVLLKLYYDRVNVVQGVCNDMATDDIICNRSSHMKLLFFCGLAAMGLSGFFLGLSLISDQPNILYLVLWHGSRVPLDILFFSCSCACAAAFAMVGLSVFVRLYKLTKRTKRLIEAEDDNASSGFIEGRFIASQDREVVRLSQRALFNQIMGSMIAVTTPGLAGIGMLAVGHAIGNSKDRAQASLFILTFLYIPQAVDFVAQAASAAILSNAVGVLWRRPEVAGDEQSASSTPRQNPHNNESSHGDLQNQQTAWKEKVKELANRGFTLEALLKFYRGLGTQYMQHYKSEESTTEDVVREAIIPLTASEMCAYATLMGRRKPQKMVTHYWGSLFVDLVAAVVADALDECHYSVIAYLLKKDITEESVNFGVDVIWKMLHKQDKLKNTYWICAFSVNQHAGICHNLANCACGLLPKHFEGDLCEMNKFDNMMAECCDRQANPSFAQVIAVDRKFKLFERAWCVDELAQAHKSRMHQHLKVLSGKNLQENQDTTDKLDVRDLKASVPKDAEFILSRIHDTDGMNEYLKKRINSLFEKSRSESKDATQMMERAARVACWHSLVELVPYKSLTPVREASD